MELKNKRDTDNSETYQSDPKTWYLIIAYQTTSLSTSNVNFSLLIGQGVTLKKWAQLIKIKITNPNQTLTLSGARSPAIIFKIVDLPVPEGPIIPTASPCLIYSQCRKNRLKDLVSVISKASSNYYFHW